MTTKADAGAIAATDCRSKQKDKERQSKELQLNLQSTLLRCDGQIRSEGSQLLYCKGLGVPADAGGLHL